MPKKTQTQELKKKNKNRTPRQSQIPDTQKKQLLQKF